MNRAAALGVWIRTFIIGRIPATGVEVELVGAREA
jgi:hypothetical protein